MLRPRPLHRLFRVEPGLAPRWVASGSCDGGDVLIWIEVLLILSAIMVWQHAPAVSIALVVATIAFYALLHSHFEDVERFARARRRRGECISCGLKLQSQAVCDTCSTAGRTTPSGRRLAAPMPQTPYPFIHVSPCCTTFSSGQRLSLRCGAASAMLPVGRSANCARHIVANETPVRRCLVRLLDDERSQGISSGEFVRQLTQGA